MAGACRFVHEAMALPDSDYNDALLNATGQRNWLFLGLVLSLALHLILYVYLYETRFVSADMALAPKAQPPAFKVKPLDTQSTLEKASIDQTNPAAKPEPDKTNIQLPDEKKSFDKLLQEVQATTAMPDDTQDVLPDRPRVDPAPATSLLKENGRSTAKALSKDPNATQQQSFLSVSAVSGRPQPALSGTELATRTKMKRPTT